MNVWPLGSVCPHAPLPESPPPPLLQEKSEFCSARPGHWPQKFQLAFSGGDGLVPGVCPCIRWLGWTLPTAPTSMGQGPGVSLRVSPCRGCTQQGHGLPTHPAGPCGAWSSLCGRHFLRKAQGWAAQGCWDSWECSHSPGVLVKNSQRRPHLGDHQGGLNHGHIHSPPSVAPKGRETLYRPL